MEKPFRRGDRITVHWGQGRTSKGRVICHNRKNLYGLSVIILFESTSGEIAESFMPDGRRYRRDKTYITHGWEDTE